MMRSILSEGRRRAKTLVGEGEGDTAATASRSSSGYYYWLNWRVVLCGILVLVSTAFALFLIFKFEGPKHRSHNNNNVGNSSNSRTSESERERRVRGEDERRKAEEEEEESCGVLYADEVWKACVKGMHPAWLLAFRVSAFFVLFLLLILNAIVDGPSIFYYYTQWTFTLVTLYFGVGSVISMYGCYEYHNTGSGERGRVHNQGMMDSERGGDNDYMTTTATHHPYPNPNPNTPHARPRPTAGFWGYLLQIMFQINAGAVMLTDMVFWFIIVPFLTSKNYHLNFIIINMHTVNLVFLLADTAFNCLHFPWFRIAYFILWTSCFVIFQWLLHACISIWWPYPFLDLSSSYAPLWYSTVALMHIPCYAIFFLIIKLKHLLFTTYFPHSYQCPNS